MAIIDIKTGHGTVSIRPARWPEDASILRAIRQKVFIIEQQVPQELEWDGKDSHCWHVIATLPDGQAIATGRLQSDGKIGRMAVLAEYRRAGVGGFLLNALISIAKEQALENIHLHAQVHAKAFYANQGFEACGEPFNEAGIAHLAMRLPK